MLPESGAGEAPSTWSRSERCERRHGERRDHEARREKKPGTHARAVSVTVGCGRRHGRHVGRPSSELRARFEKCRSRGRPARDAEAAEDRARAGCETDPCRSTRAHPVPAAAKPARKVTKTSPSTARFVADLLTRGEAAERDAKGRLPRRATHEVTKRNPDGTVAVKRVRFKLF